MAAVATAAKLETTTPVTIFHSIFNTI